jgi:membrane-bound lytic murein transglycosylase B
MFQPPPPLPPSSGLGRLKVSAIGLLVVVLWGAALPSFLPAPAGAGPGLLAGAALPSDAEWARLRHEAWLRGRQAAADAERAREAARRAAAGTGATAGAGVVPVGGDRAIPALALRAYKEAAAWAAGFDPGCGLTWPVLAGIGRIESNHGMHGGAATRFTAGGTVSPRITGPALDGRGVARIPDSDGGRWDGDTTWDRAVGPMQFIPSTWRSLGRDGNGDGVADPNNLFDSAVSAAAYLCLSVDGSLSDQAVLRQAIYNYNHSWPYVDAILGWARLYGGGVTVAAGAPTGTAAAPGTSGTSGTTRAAAARATTRASSASRHATSTTKRSTTTRASSTTGSSTTGSTTTTTRPCQPTTTATTTSSSSTTTTTTTTTTTLPDSSTTTTTLPPCA